MDPPEGLPHLGTMEEPGLAVTPSLLCSIKAMFHPSRSQEMLFVTPGTGSCAFPSTSPSQNVPGAHHSLSWHSWGCCLPGAEGWDGHPEGQSRDGASPQLSVFVLRCQQRI